MHEVGRARSPEPTFAILRGAGNQVAKARGVAQDQKIAVVPDILDFVALRRFGKEHFDRGSEIVAGFLLVRHQHAEKARMLETPKHIEREKKSRRAQLPR